MALPQLAIGAALLAGGAYTQNRAVSRQNRAASDSARRAIALQMQDHERYDSRRQELIDQALEARNAGRGALETEMEDRAAELQRRMEENRKRNAGFDDQPAYETSALDTDGGQSQAGARVFEDHMAGEFGARDAEAAERIAALSRMHGLGGALSRGRIASQPAFAHLGMESGFARDRANQLPLEIQAGQQRAAGKGQGTMALGSLMTAGGMAMMGNAGGAAAGAGGAGGAGGVTLGGATSQTLNAARAAQMGGTAGGMMGGMGGMAVNPYLLGTALSMDPHNPAYR